MSAEYESSGVARADRLEVSEHARTKLLERATAEDPFPSDTIRQIVASVQRGQYGTPPHVPVGLEIVVNWQAKRVVTVYTTDRDRPRVIRA